jgi:excinuclease ABC subunit C
MLNPHGELIYVGKAKCLRARLLSYFRPRSRDRKAGRILAQTGAIAWEVGPDEFAALHRELELIRRWRPRLNVQGQPHGRRFTFVCLGRSPAPFAFLTRQPPRGALAFGPIRAGEQAREAVRRVNDAFLLRDCAQSQEMLFADQRELFPVLRSAGCLRHEIGTCLGPCTAACTSKEYAARVRAARAFLEGQNKKFMARLEQELTAASTALGFERAAALRDKWQALAWLHDQLEQVRRLRADGSFVYQIQGQVGELWYLIHHGSTVAAVRAPRDSQTRGAAANRIKALYQGHDAQELLDSVEHLNGMFLVASWFRRYPQERRHLLRPEQALSRCRSS